MHRLISRLQDPQLVGTWIIQQHPSTVERDGTHHVFEGHYERRRFHTLVDNEKKHVESINEKCHGSAPLLFERDPLSIWKQVENDNYIISYYAEKDLNTILWAIAHEGNVLWSKLIDTRDRTPAPSSTFPKLINHDYDSFRELHGTHKAEIEQRQHDLSIWKWCCIVGAISVLVTLLVTCCGFKCFYSNRKKKWQFRREGVSRNAHDDDDRKVILDIQEGVEKDLAPPEEGVQEVAENDTAARRFNDLMVNSAAVHDVLMDDVLGEMETDGGDKDDVPESKKAECDGEVHEERDSEDGQVPTKR